MSRASFTHEVERIEVTTAEDGSVVILFNDTTVLLDNGHEYELLETLGRVIKERDNEELGQPRKTFLVPLLREKDPLEIDVPTGW